MKLPLTLRLYRWGVMLAAPFSGLVLNGRAKRGKEDPARLPERFGHATINRPAGRLIWLHGASVGESLVLRSLVTALAAATDWHFLVTTGTTTSAALMEKQMPPRTIHQYVPVDRPACARRFMDHWRPDAAVFVESELWPNLLIELQARNIPAILANARMNQASLDNWAQRTDSLGYLLQTFRWIGAADERTAAGLSRLTDRDIPLTGNLKLQIEPPAPEAAKLEEIRSALAGRPVWLAASTHPGEDEMVLEAHKVWRNQHPKGLMILAPRHPDRADALAELLTRTGMSFARRSRGEFPVTETRVWLADTLGEMALWYAVSGKAFIGGSLVDGIGGHNPIEATRAGCPVITGPFTASFDDIFTAYHEHGGVLIASGAEEIAAALENDPEALLAGARDALGELTGSALAETLASIHALLPAEQP